MNDAVPEPLVADRCATTHDAGDAAKAGPVNMRKSVACAPVRSRPSSHRPEALDLGRSGSGDAALETWRRLAMLGDPVDRFSCLPEWQLSFHEQVNPGTELVVRTGPDAHVGFRRVIARDGKVSVTPIEALWSFGCNLLGPRALELAAETVRSLNGVQGENPGTFTIGGVERDGAFERQVRQHFDREYATFPSRPMTNGVASLDGGIDGYLGRRSGSFRSGLMKQYRRARRAGVTFERMDPSNRDEAGALFARMHAVERRSWKRTVGSGLLRHPYGGFYRTLLERLSERGAARVILAIHEERDIGYIFGGVAGEIYRGQQFSFDDAWQKASIGNLLQLEQIMALCSDGVRRYEMGPMTGPGMAYKAHWVEKTRHSRSIILRRQ